MFCVNRQVNDLDTSARIWLNCSQPPSDLSISAERPNGD